MIRFSLFNIPVTIQPFFWLTMALIGGGLRADSRQEFLYLLLFVLAGLISILVHELGHALTARKFGHRVQIVLQAFGGYASYTGGQMNHRSQSLLITAAGPAIQILLGIAMLYLANSIPNLPPSGRYFLQVLYWISFAWAILNLLPILPLDGGRLLQTFLGPAKFRLTLTISIAVAVAVAVLSFLRMGGFLLPLFMLMFAYENYKSLKNLRA